MRMILVAAFLLAAASAASGEELTEAQARAVIAPWYGLFNQPVAAEVVKVVHEQFLSPDYQSCWGVLPGECWGRDQSMKVVGNFAKSIPDMKFDIKEVLVSGNRVIVRGEVSGTPSGELFGVPHGGKTYFEWKGQAFGADIAGTTIVTRNEDGLIESIRLYHRPFRAVIQFSAELAKRLAGKVDAAMFAGGPQSGRASDI